MKIFISVILSITLLSACASLPKSTPPPTLPNNPTPTHIVIIPPTSTPSPTEFRPTPTETPTPPLIPPAELLAKLNIQPDRTYTVVDNYYVDSYNGAKLAYLDNGVWRETTPEEKYGFLAPLNPSEPYINTDGKFFTDANHQGDFRYEEREFYVVWTGDTVERQAMNEGAQITEVDGIFVIRDVNGELVQLKVRLDSPDVQGGFHIYTLTQLSPTSALDSLLVGDPKDILPVGKQLDVLIYYQVPDNAIVPSRCGYGMCTDENNAGYRQFWLQKARIQAFIDALRAGTTIPEDPELVLVPMYIELKK